MQQQALAVGFKALTFVVGQVGGRVRPKGQLIDKNHHLLPIGKGAFHKVKGAFQRVPGQADGILPLAHLGVKAGAHGIKGSIAIQRGVKGSDPGMQQSAGGGDNSQLFPGQGAGSLLRGQVVRIDIDLRGKHGGGHKTILGGVGVVQGALKAAHFLVAGVRHRVCPAGSGKAGVQPGQQQADKADALIKSGFLCALQHGGKGAALQNIFHAVILAVLLYSSQ